MDCILHAGPYIDFEITLDEQAIRAQSKAFHSRLYSS